MKTSLSDETDYIKIVEAAVRGELPDFKRHPRYRDILEHASQEQGLQYINLIVNRSYDLYEMLNKFSENDTIGNPITFFYPGIGQFSPTTLRYVKVASDLKLRFGDLSGMDIIEIGCGYGGQSKILTDVFNLKSYTYIDLNPVLELIKQYMNNFDIKCDLHFVKYSELHKLFNSYDLVISNYAISECDAEIQKTYINKVLNCSDRGYITYNYIPNYGIEHLLSIDEFINLIDKEIQQGPEEPKTGPNNCILHWSNK